ncbi:hypothetical protein V1477_000510 [Vespula maculifrons]|uniref:Uncharacterized protein n=1 Tax=Vespula maculifrons TaxID=7453 RepID=A0ABD2D1Z7_VESMC
MSEADGVDSGAICKRGFIHLQFAEKPEAPEAERHLGSRILERRRISFLPSGQDRRTLAYVGWHRRWCSRARLSPNLALTHSTYSRECFRNARVSIVTAVDSILGSGVCRESTIGRAQVVIEASDSAGLQLQQPPRGGTWVGSTCVSSKSYGVQVLPSEWLRSVRLLQNFSCVIRNYTSMDLHLTSDVSSNGLVHIRLLDANTGRIERTLARVSAGTGVMFSGAINSPTLMDFV